MSGKTSLYLYFDAGDRLLYVGVAGNPFTREKQHRANHDMEQVRHIELEWFETRERAEAAERFAIDRERPLWNLAHKRKKRELRTTQVQQANEKPKPQTSARRPSRPPEPSNKLVATSVDEWPCHTFGPIAPTHWRIMLRGEADAKDAGDIMDIRRQWYKVARALREGDNLWLASSIERPDLISEWAQGARMFILDVEPAEPDKVFFIGNGVLPLGMSEAPKPLQSKPSEPVANRDASLTPEQHVTAQAAWCDEDAGLDDRLQAVSIVYGRKLTRDDRQILYYRYGRPGAPKPLQNEEGQTDG